MNMRNKVLYVSALLLLLSSVNAQIWFDDPGFSSVGFEAYQGSQVPSLYSTVIWPTTPLPTDDLRAEQQFTGTLTPGLFVASDVIYHATSLFQFSLRDISPTKLYFYVDGVTTNAAKTSYNITLSYLDKELGSNDATSYAKIGISVILIGSSFSGEASYTQSSYIYARNGQLEEVLYPDLISTATRQRVAQFDFANSAQGSPFAYVPGAYSGKCGMIKDTASSRRIVEVSGCAYSRFYTFVTGFVVEDLDPNAPLTDLIDLSAQIVSSPDSTVRGITAFPETSGVNSIYKETTTDNQVGLWVSYSNYPQSSPASSTYRTVKIQLSFVFVGLRSFNDAGNALDYPKQHIYKTDDFIHNAGVWKNKMGQAIPIVDPTFNSVLFPNDGSTVSSILYSETQGIGYGNAFCGILDIRLHQSSPSIDFTLTLDSTTSLNIVLPLTTAPNQLASLQCLLFRKRNTCDGTPALLAPFSGPRGFTIADNSIDIDVSTGTISGTSSLNFDLKLTQVVNANTVKVTINYNRLFTEATAFKVSVQLPFTLPSGVTVFDESVKITAFGQVVKQLTFTASADYAVLSAPLQFYVVSADKAQNNVVIEYRSTQHAITAIRVAAVQYTSLLNGFDCVTSCPARAGAVVAFNPVFTPPTCEYCTISQNLIPNIQNGGCQCIESYYYDSATQACKVCSVGFNLCGQCNALTCSGCVENAEETLVSGAITACTCKTGFYPSGNKCVPCPFGCSACTSATSCTACHPNLSNGQPTRGLPKCQCRPRFYENNVDFVCPSCSPRCLTCSGSANDCLTCDVAGNFIKNGQTCECRTGYYELNTGSSLTCEKCDVTCLTCSISSLYCDSCSADDFRVLAGTSSGHKQCNCKAGYIDIQGTCIDSNCSNLDPFCQTCAYDPVAFTSVCLSCGTNRYLLNNKCKCKPGFYQLGSGSTATCQKCGTGCALCGMDNNELLCFQCANGATNNGDGTCACPTGTLSTLVGGIVACRSCDSTCASCFNTPSFCTSCPTGFVLANNQCKCASGTYLATSQTRCLPCMNNCNSCKRTTSGALECTECAEDYVWDGSQCSLTCINGKYRGVSECLLCPSTCTSCLTAQLCLTCAADHYLFAGSCRKTCPIGTTIVGGQCLACQSPCSTCSEGGAKCDSCLSGYLYFNGKCVTDCPVSTYFGDSGCLPCSSRCLTCSGTSTNCVSCASTQYLFNNDCFNTCPVAIVNGTCTNVCPDGKFYKDSACKNCDVKCLTCSGSADNCIACASGLISYGGSCLTSCPKGTYLSGNTCSRCDISCQECKESSIACTKCAAGFIQQANYCVEKCQDGFYKDYSGYCKECGIGCKTCSSPTVCTACFDSSLTPSNGKCVKTCPPGSVSDGNKCSCTFGVFHLNSCISTCPEGYYAHNKVCEHCQSPCKRCAGTPYNCLSCVDGYNYNSDTNRCTRANVCPYGERSEGNTCVRICGNAYLYKTTCIPGCPVGYEHNGHGACVENNNPTFCPAGKFQQGSSCVDYCQAGYFANHYTYNCDRCPNHCALCISADLCVTCDNGFILENNKCVPKISCKQGWIQYNGRCYDGCPAGTYPLGSYTCMAICPSGTYFWNPYCYESCPTGLRTGEACVNSCPNGYTRWNNECKHS